ncbi:MAG TPA: sigma-70 family RNA polymerase sigma factor [Gammaproteobacteria bacterium]
MRNGADRSGRLLSAFLDCRDLLGRVVRRLVRPEDVDDILQETFIRAYVAAKETEIRHPRAFMVKTARNVAMNKLLSADSQRTCSMEDYAPSAVYGSTETLESEIEAKERFLGFCRAVRALPAQCRRVFVLKKVYGLSQQEIAKHLGISESTVEKHVAKGLLMCARSMEDAGLGEDRRRRAGSRAARAEQD